MKQIMIDFNLTATKLVCLLLIVLQPDVYGQEVPVQRTLRVGVAGLTHGHVHWILGAAQRGELEIVGIAEADKDLAERLMSQYNIPSGVLYTDLSKMLTAAKPEAVTAFGSIYDHLMVVKECAPRKIHVMVEKPLAVSLDHARQMEQLARQHNIHLLTNYETTWYGSNHRAFQMIHEQKLFGDITKMVVHDGHQGPKEIGVNKEFLEWLTDPRLNGGGALMDFGCYGANLITWLMKGQRPLSVFAVTQQIKPHIYSKVDDEATIVVTYPKAQAIIQASWNWPYSRKDMEIYGKTGFITADKKGIRYLTDAQIPVKEEEIEGRQIPYNDPFAFLTAIIRGNIKMNDDDLSSLPVNMTAMEILDAAQQSARSGKVIYLPRK
ncbi:MAG: Gfo/Idh/MocA family oxidoreductase [Chryseosolibacter sp.]